MANRPIRLLILHGFRQNGTLLSKRLGSLRKEMKDVEFVSPDGTFEVKEGQCGWWNATDDGSHYRGLKQTLDRIKELNSLRGPFDGVLGFSQGGMLASILCALQDTPNLHRRPPVEKGKGQQEEEEEEVLQVEVQVEEEDHGDGVEEKENEEKRDSPFPVDWNVELKCAIIVGAALPRDLQVKQELFNEKKKKKKETKSIEEDNKTRINLPTLHIFGEKDEIITCDRSRLLANVFENPQIYCHEGGHFVPSNKEARKIVSSFIRTNCL